MWYPLCERVELERTERGKEMVELKFEYFRNMEEVANAFLTNGYKLMVEQKIDKSEKRWKKYILLTAVKNESCEEIEE